MCCSNKYSPEVRERAVRMMLEHQSAHDSQWAAIGSIVEKIGCPPSVRVNCGIRSKPITESGASRSPIPIQADH